MRPHGGHDQRRTARRRTDASTLTTFTVGLPRWPVLVRLWGRNPLVHRTDRLQALVLALAVVVSLLAVPIAAAIGTAVHDSRRAHYAEQAETRTPVVATVTDVPSFTDNPPIGAITVPARWSVGGTEHTGVVAVPSTADIGDPVEIWIDSTGTWVPEPTSTGRAAGQAVTVALLAWIGVAGVATLLFITTRVVCGRIRFLRWQQGLAGLVDDGHGHTSTHP